MATPPTIPSVRTVKVRTSKVVAPKADAGMAVTDAASGAPKRKTLSKKSTLSAAVVHTASALPVSHEMIAIAAYYLAEHRHFAPGLELQDWLTAEQRLRSQ